MTHPHRTVDVYGLTWDKTLPVPQIVSYTLNGVSMSVVYGINRALSIDASGTAAGFEHSVLGDVTGGFASVSSGFDPYGEQNAGSTSVDVGFGYRGELHVGDMVYLRFRDHDPTLGRFTTIDPLDGVPGTTTVANQYAYAGNDPVGAVDPFGLRPTDPGFAVDGEPLRLGEVLGGFPALEALTSEVTVTRGVTTFQLSDFSIVRADLRTGTFVESRVFEVDTVIGSPTTRIVFRNQAPQWMRSLSPAAFAQAARRIGLVGTAVDAVLVVDEVRRAPTDERLDTLGQGVFRIAGSAGGAYAGGAAGFACGPAAVVCIPAFAFGGGWLGNEFGGALYDPFAEFVLDPVGDAIKDTVFNPYEFARELYGWQYR